jgi:hypothetical protein
MTDPRDDLEDLTSLAAVIDAAATQSGVEGERQADGTTTWSGVAGPFAALAADGASAEFRLDPTLADAATRTPDVTSTSRGAAWVRFTPRELDGHAIDRALAWFAAAARRSGD